MPHPQILPTPSNPTGSGVFTTYTSTTIHTPASLVWSTLIDFPSYSSWNTFTPTVSFPSATPVIGEAGTLEVFMTGTDSNPRSVREIVTSFSPSTRSFSWKAHDISPYILRPERVQEVIGLDPGPNGEERCEYRTWETFAGPMAWVVWWWVGEKLDKAFERCAEDLKRFVEGKGVGSTA